MRKPGFLSLFLSSFTLTICVLFPHGGDAATKAAITERDR